MGKQNSFHIRQQQILDFLLDQGQVTVLNLAELLNVTPETIRRDLNKLHQQKLLKKVHGGAVNIQSKFEKKFIERCNYAVDEKRAIGIAASNIIKSGDTLFVDFGSTTYEFCNNIKKINNLTVITNSPILVDILQENLTIEVILIGGVFNAEKNACLGEIVLDNIIRFFADYSVIGVGAFHEKHGIMNQNAQEAAIARAMIQQSNKVIVLSDASKYNKYALNHVTDWNNIHYLVTTTKEKIKLPQHSICQIIIT